MARFIKNFAHLLRRTAVSALVVAGAIVLPLAPVRAQDDPQLFETVRAADMRVADIGWLLASANAALCDRIEAGTGMQLHTLDQFDPESREAARRHFGFASEVAIEGVVPGSPADGAGLRADDSRVRVGSILISGIAGKPASTDRLVAAQLAIAALPPQDAMEIEVIRKGAPIRVTLHPVPICKSRFEMRIADDWGASADGTMVQIGSRFVEEYSENELASVMAHEFAHNVMRHREKLEARGVDYGMLAGFGRNVKYFRQTELQADLLSVYLLANANYPVRAAIDFWKRFGPSNAGGILRSRSHPAWRDRIATIEAEIAKVESVPARPVIPALLADRAVPLSGDWQSLLVRHR